MRLLKKLTKISEEEHEIDEKRGEFLIYSYVSKHPDNWMPIDKDEEPDMYWFVKKNKKELRKLGFHVRWCDYTSINCCFAGIWPSMLHAAEPVTSPGSSPRRLTCAEVHLALIMGHLLSAGSVC